jgi:DNA repair protein RecN (Recombination protein N)
MLKSLSIRNYALINQLDIDFHPGLSIITGETGAGKSILLGAMSLILGQRADTSVLSDKSKKCIAEGTFFIKEYKLQDFFSDNGLDYEDITIIRREINEDGKSRAFINDSPVNISILKDMGTRLVDIHSQHQSLNLGNHLFQLRVIDSFAQNGSLLDDYKAIYQKYKTDQAVYADLLSKSEKEKNDFDYYSFQFNQLDEAKLIENEQDELETEINTLKHSEEIKTILSRSSLLLSGEGSSSVYQVKEAMQMITKLKAIYPKAEGLSKRMESIYIELKDIASEIELLGEKLEHDPQRLENIGGRLDLIYSLEQKHRVSHVNDLIEIRDQLETRLNEITGFDDKMEALKKQITEQQEYLSAIASKISENRSGVATLIESTIIELLKQLGIPNANFKITLRQLDEFTSNGLDEVSFLFSANKQSDLQEISKVASGGELSRLMLSIKSVMTRSLGLPTVIFDEIDSGISGEIADKMGNIIQQMAEQTQVINITHLPQIAGKGKHHYLVYKKDDHQATYTHIKLLTDEERITEIAKMLSGEVLTDAAIINARELLKN